MISIPGDRAVRAWGLGVGLAALLDALRISVRLMFTAPDAHLATGAARVLADRPLLIVALTLLLLAAWLLYLRKTRLTYGIVALVSLFVIVRVRLAAFDSGHQDFMQSGAAMAGWLIGHVYARTLGLDDRGGSDERLEVFRYAATAAIAVFAATYMCAGTSKILNSGGHWLDSDTVRLMVASHLQVDGNSIWNQLRRWIVETPGAGTALESVTLLAQLGAFLLLCGGAARAVFGAALVGFHLGTWITADIVFVAPMVLAAVFAIPWGARIRSSDAVKIDAYRAKRVMRNLAVALAVWLGLIWLTPFGRAIRFGHQPWQSRTPGQFHGSSFESPTYRNTSPTWTRSSYLARHLAKRSSTSCATDATRRPSRA